MKILIWICFLPLVFSFDYYYIINNNQILTCGNTSEQAFNFNWYKAESGVFKNLSIFQQKISITSSTSCPAVYYCQYEEKIENIEYTLSTTDLFVINCPIVKEDLVKFHETTQKTIDKIPNNNFYLLIFLLIIFSFYYVIKKFDLKKLIINKPV